jgi:uncharacterized DUF497 family protein
MTNDTPITNEPDDDWLLLDPCKRCGNRTRSVIQCAIECQNEWEETNAMTADLSHLFTGSDEAESITVSPEYVLEKLSYIDGIDAHLDEGGQVSIDNMRDLIGFARQFAKGYAQHANLLKVVIADRERVMAARNAANEELYRLRHTNADEAERSAS